MPKISGLPVLSSPADDDEIAVVDDSAATTKKLTLGNLLVWLQNKLAWITPNMLNLQPDEDYIVTSETTTSSSFTDLATVGPEVTVNVGQNGLLLVGIYAYEDSSTGDNRPSMGFALSGANTASASDDKSIVMEAVAGGSEQRQGATFLLTGLNPGSTTITAKYKRVSGSGSSIFATRRVWAVPL